MTFAIFTKADRRFLRAVGIAEPSPDVSSLAVGEDEVANEDPTLEFLKRNNIPLTRANYLQVAYLGNPPELDAEQEADLPDVDY